MSRERETYDREFKLSVVKMIKEYEMKLSEVSRDFGVNENSLH